MATHLYVFLLPPTRKLRQWFSVFVYLFFSDKKTLDGSLGPWLSLC